MVETGPLLETVANIVTNPWQCDGAAWLRRCMCREWRSCWMGIARSGRHMRWVIERLPAEPSPSRA
jgi:hypothetical protein